MTGMISNPPRTGDGRRRLARALLAGLAVTTALLGPAAPAAAAVPGLVVRTVAGLDRPGDQRSASVTCPGDKQPLSGGFDIDFGFGVVEQLRPVPGSFPHLIVAAHESDPWPDDWRVSAVALCADPLPGLVRTSGSTPASSLDIKIALARCPAGKRLVGAGYEVREGAGQVVIQNVLPGSAAVFVTAAEEEPYTGNWNVLAYAVCADPLPGLTRVTQSARGSDFVSVLVGCPAGTVLLGGGFEMTGPPGQMTVEAFLPRPTGTAPPTALTVRAEEEDPFAHEWVLTGHAICADA
jgi:hypothetical protein